MRTALRHRLHEHFVAWALRLSGTRPPEPVPVVLSRQRIYVLPTRGGLLYALALLVLLIGAINYNLSLGYGLVFLLGGLGVVTILHTFRNLAGTVLRVGIPLPVHAGDIARFPLLLDNAGRRMRHQIGLSLPGQPATWADVPTQDSTRYLLPLSAIRRGWLAMPRVTIETSWPLGLVRAWAYAAPAQTCLVYPRPATAAPPPPDFPGLRGGRRDGSAGDEDFAGLRRHQPGDPPHHIAWKTAARLGPQSALQTKQFSGTATPTRWLDWAALPAGLDVESRLSLLTRALLDAEAAGLIYGLRLPGNEIAPARGAAHAHRCLKVLALHGQPD